MQIRVIIAANESEFMWGRERIDWLYVSKVEWAIKGRNKDVPAKLINFIFHLPSYMDRLDGGLMGSAKIEIPSCNMVHNII